MDCIKSIRFKVNDIREVIEEIVKIANDSLVKGKIYLSVTKISIHEFRISLVDVW